VLAAAETMEYPVRALRFVDNVYDYMHAADAFVTKPGGLSLAEGLVAGLPIVLCKPLPGQEERNARVLCEAGAAIRARTVNDLPAALTAVLTDENARQTMLAAASQLGRPNAAGEAAATIARLVSMRAQVVA
jgi:processive 1,2-diacylglycerol beta-glucosyltransferase